MGTPTVDESMSEEKQILWAEYFRKYEPKVSDFIDHLEWAAGEKFNLYQVLHILKPTLHLLVTSERIRLGPNFTGKPS